MNLKLKNKLTGEFDISGSIISVVGYFAHMELINGFSKTLYMSLEKSNRSLRGTQIIQH
jgi:recombinational DNA repair protein RecT